MNDRFFEALELLSLAKNHVLSYDEFMAKGVSRETLESLHSKRYPYLKECEKGYTFSLAGKDAFDDENERREREADRKNREDKRDIIAILTFILAFITFVITVHSLR